jgi:hypothetical protein
MRDRRKFGMPKSNFRQATRARYAREFWSTIIYQRHCADALARLRAEGRYRVFADLASG